MEEAQKRLLTAHAERLTRELNESGKSGEWPGWVKEFEWDQTKPSVSIEDIACGHAPRPRVLDMFAGGGAIPLEALRLGCDAYAIDLNPVAHIIQLCTLAYPQKYGEADIGSRGVTGPENENGESTWGGLAREVHYWGEWVIKKVKSEIGDLYPPIPDKEYKDKRPEIRFDPDTGIWVTKNKKEDAKDKDGLFEDRAKDSVAPPGYLIPVMYLWTHTVRCKNPHCSGHVPLLRQSWLCKSKDRYVALRMIVPTEGDSVHFEVVEEKKENTFDFDPGKFSRGGNAVCPFCYTVIDIKYIKNEGWAGRMDQQFMAAVCIRPGQKGKVYLSAADCSVETVGKEQYIQERLQHILTTGKLDIPNEPIAGLPEDSRKNTLGITVRPYGFRSFSDFFLPRQMLSVMTSVWAIRQALVEMNKLNDTDRTRAVTTYLGCMLDRLADYNSVLCRHHYLGSSRIGHTFGRQTLNMVWDFTEANPFHFGSGGWDVESVTNAITAVLSLNTVGALSVGNVIRGSATEAVLPDGIIDVIVTDPPYYDNVPYADISDYFYVWLKRTIGDLYPEHFANECTPKKKEAIADTGRHQGDRIKAKTEYENMMHDTFSVCHRALKSGGLLVTVYAHKTTRGWTTLVNSLRRAGFTVEEAWPLSTENPSRLRAHKSAALASSIFLVARKRKRGVTGSYEKNARPRLKEIVHERVNMLWNQGISGADLVIACVGAGLGAFTCFEKIEYANGEEMPTEKFLAEVEEVVLDAILNRLYRFSAETAGNEKRHYNLAGIDSITRFYILWRYTYRWADIDAGEAIIFANGTHVELDGAGSLSYGAHALVVKENNKYHLRDYTERGENKGLGLPENGSPASVIDALHRTLWLMEYSPKNIPEFLDASQVSKEQMRLVAQALAGPALQGGETGEVSPTTEQSSLKKIIANWGSVVEDPTAGIPGRRIRDRDQKSLFERR